MIATWSSKQFNKIKSNELFLKDFEIVGEMLKHMFKESPLDLSDTDITRELLTNGYIIIK